MGAMMWEEWSCDARQEGGYFISSLISSRTAPRQGTPHTPPSSDSGWFVRNPLARFGFFDEPHRVRFLTDAELKRLKDVMSSSGGWDFVVFAIETGLRQSEQFGLRWDCVDLENGILTIPMLKQGQTHEVPLTETAKTVLRRFDSFLSSSSCFGQSEMRADRCVQIAS
jgi:integrase